MTEAWMREVKKIERLSPHEDLLKRAERGPSLPPSPRGPRARVGKIVLSLTIAVLLVWGLIWARGGNTAQVAATSPTPTGSTSSTPERAVLPTQGAVQDGRFVVSVALDNGKFRVDPAPADVQPTSPMSPSMAKAFADPVFQGQNRVVFGFGLVTRTVSGADVPTVEAMPAWIGFGWGAVSNCPMITGPLKHYHLPSSGYVAVALPDGQDAPPFNYRAETSTCGYSPTGPSVGVAHETVSIPWTQVGPFKGTSVTVRYAVSSCGTKPTFTAGGVRGVYTLSVLTTLPDAPQACSSSVPVTSTFQLAPSPGPGTPTYDITKLLPGPLGPVGQMNP